MRISDWSSDVCSSDLIAGGGDLRKVFQGSDLEGAMARHPMAGRLSPLPLAGGVGGGTANADGSGSAPTPSPDRKSVVKGKSVTVRVDLGVRSIIKTTEKNYRDNVNASNNIRQY